MMIAEISSNLQGPGQALLCLMPRLDTDHILVVASIGPAGRG